MTQAIQNKAVLDVGHHFEHIHSEHIFSIRAHFLKCDISLLDPEYHWMWLRVG